MAEPLAFQRTRTSASGERHSAPRVFLSYAHVDRGIALPFRDALASCGLEILIDVDHLPAETSAICARAGAARRCNHLHRVNRQPVLEWVVFEAVITLQKEHINPAARLIACASDQAFFDPGFRQDNTVSTDRG